MSYLFKNNTYIGKELSLKFYNKIIFKICFFIILKLLLIKLPSNKEIKVCVCTIGKIENRYIREFVEHYKNYGVDKIFLYDNNDINGEKFEDVINDYIVNGFVQLVNYRGKIHILMEMMNDCYKKQYHNFNWLIFFEIDEYIYLNKFKSIKHFFKNPKFQKCERIQFNWIFHTDNNLLYYDPRPLKERFNEREKKARNNSIGNWNGIKSILRGHIPNIKINCVHTLNHKLKSCDPFGNPKKIDGIITKNADFKYYYIDHYYSKSTEEFINKINKGDALFVDNRMERIRTYFAYNQITKQKIDLMEKKTGLNLSQIRRIINI